MKKVLFLACACLVASTSTVAQTTIIQSETTTTQTFYVEPEPKKETGYPRYQGELNVGYETPDAALLETIHGVRINKYLFVGAGLALHYVNSVYVENDDFYMDVSEEKRIPLFFNAKAFLPVGKKTDTYFNLSLGGDIGVDYGSGVYCDLGLGLKHRKFNLGLGWMLHGINEEVYDYYYEGMESFNYNAFYLKIGLCW